MILIDQPYVSDFLRQTVRDEKLPLVLTPAARSLGFEETGSTLTEEEALQRLRREPGTRILASSENALDWVAENLDCSPLPGTIELFKNKLIFRRLLAPLYPDFRFREVSPQEALVLDPETVGFPFVLKPAVGFFSLGVYVVRRPEDWAGVLPRLQAMISNPGRLYPRRVMDASSFILEEIITGIEYAIDAYFDSAGCPVITNILEHRFSSDEDVSDRVYQTGEKTIRDNLERFTQFLEKVGALAGLKDFPVHVEVRVDDQGRIVPIEINPLRFGGWCTTADLTALAFGFNPYVAFLRDQRPDWDEIFATRAGRIYSIIVLDNSTGWDGADIAAFDIQGLASRFHDTIAIRPVDHSRFPLFGFLFTETPEDGTQELDWILHSDLREFVALD